MRNTASRATWWTAGIDDADGARANGRWPTVTPSDSAYPAVFSSGQAPTVLLGRRNERETLDRVLKGARSGHGGTIVIHGEPGIGKSTLLSYAMASAAGFQV